MKNTLRSKTLTASLETAPSAVFARIAELDNLPLWHNAFCRSLRKEAGTTLAESPRGVMPVRLLRNDHAQVLDLLIRVSESSELLTAIRVLANGTGTEVTLTLIQPVGFSDAAFHEQVRWAESALRALRKIESPKPAPVIASAVTETPVVETVPVAQKEPPATSDKKIFIGNLPFDWSEEMLRGLFADLGTLASVTIARFRNQGRSRGFGFVEMTTEAEAQGAILKLHESLAGGRKIIVRLAHLKESRPEKESTEKSAVTAPIAKTPPQNRPAPRRTPLRDARPKPASRTRSAMPRAPRAQDIQNKSGYEYFPRKSSGLPDPVSSQREEPAARPLETSPYFDDTGDVENHSQRPPRRRR